MVLVWDIKTGKLIKELGPFSIPIRAILYGEKYNLLFKPGFWFADDEGVRFCSYNQFKTVTG